MVSNRYIMGIDGGSQSTKVTIFDETGRIHAHAGVPLQPLHNPQVGVAEHPDDDLWASLCNASRQALDQFEEDPAFIIGVGLCTIRCCRTLLKADGSLANPVISWMDLRLAEPYQHSDDSVAKVSTSSGYISHRLTNEFVDTAANLEGQWPIDKTAWDWSDNDEQVASYGLTRDQLTKLVNPGEELGRISAAASDATGIPLGLPVIATANDKAVEALGSGLANRSAVLLSLGTYIGAMKVGDELREPSDALFTNMACQPNHYLYESGGIRYGMSTISWFCSLLGSGIEQEASEQGQTPEQLLSEEAALINAGSEGLITIPEWLAPPTATYKRGIFMGLQPRHTRAHLFRSLLEAIALTMKNHVDAMNTELAHDMQELIVSGGGAASDTFMQILADVFGTATIRRENTDGAGLGAAICVAVAQGIHPNFDQAQQSMVKLGKQFNPDPANHEIYQKLNEQCYKNATHATDPTLEALAELSITRA
ncbi:MAG: FGGY-family carbohydrate kinase [Pseudomonadota bacterium]